MLDTTHDSLRLHPELQDLFARAESRHLTDDEFELYLAVAEEHAERVTAAQEMKANDAQIVRNIITDLYAIYPYAQHHNLAMPKCIRDVRYVTAYATLAMLMGDPKWFADKLLIWMKTILQSFEYPDIPAGTSRRLNPEPEVRTALASLKSNQRSIYECYFRLKADLKKTLSPAAFNEMETYLQLPIDILSND
ncbi:MAG: hypothetical protein SynsKO_36090 [Synoicihabitans sp.]